MTRWWSRACGPVAAVVTFALGGSSSGVGAQTAENSALLARKANMEVEGVSMLDALKRLQARSAVPILIARSAVAGVSFSAMWIPQDFGVSCACLDQTVEEALEILLEGTRLTFTERPSHVLVTRQDEPDGWFGARQGFVVTLLADYSLKSGWPVSTIQTLSVARLSVELAFPLSSGDAWRLEYPVSFLLALVRNNPQGPLPRRSDGSWNARARWFADARTTATDHGVGVHPLAVRVVWATGRVAIYTGLSAGLVFFDESAPGPNSRRANFTGDFELGARFTVSRGLDLVLGYQYNHMSNAHTANDNPGIDSHMVRVGVRRW